VQSSFRIKELSFVNDEPRIDQVVLNPVDNFVEGHDHGLEAAFIELKGEIRGSFQARNSDAFTCEFLRFQALHTNDDRAVAFAEAGAAIEENILFSERWISSKANGRDVVRFS
jgi:hypothetical protein